jgi:serine/threonine-protein phosphatase 2B catalytic subunit
MHARRTHGKLRRGVCGHPSTESAAYGCGGAAENCQKQNSCRWPDGARFLGASVGALFSSVIPNHALNCTCSEESERVSELKSMSGSSKLPCGTLALGAEGIKDAIRGFDDAYALFPVSSRPAVDTDTLFHTCRRKSDIENERLPPDLVDADSAEGKAYMSSSLPQTPAGDFQGNGVLSPIDVATLEDVFSSAPSSPIGPLTPTSPTSSSGPMTPFRRGHARHASLGTTMTSPSTRRRSIESTMSLLKEAVDGKEDAEFEQLADNVAGKEKSKEAKENAVPAPAR